MSAGQPRGRPTCSSGSAGAPRTSPGRSSPRPLATATSWRVELLAEVGRWLGIGMADLAAALDPGMFVIGGGVSAAGDLLLDPARDAFRRQLTGRGYRPEAAIVSAQLGNEAGLVGAADLARSDAVGG